MTGEEKQTAKREAAVKAEQAGLRRGEKPLVILSFTGQGSKMNRELCEILKNKRIPCAGYAPEKYAKPNGLSSLPDNVKAWLGELWGNYRILFIGAAGIAVRYIAPWVKDKYTDSAVLVMDERGRYIIPLLSGHVGSAVETAKEIASCIKAVPVITTATDVQGKFAVDVFARKNGLAITDREMAKAISAAVLEGEKVGFYSPYPWRGELPAELVCCSSVEELHTGFSCGVVVEELHTGFSCGVVVEELRTDFICGVAVEGEPSQTGEESAVCMTEKDMAEEWRDGRKKGCRQKERILYLAPKTVVAGIGCRRGISREILEKGLKQILEQHGLSDRDLLAVASIDLKKDEPGLVELAGKYGIPFWTYTAEELKQAETISEPSDFVKQVTGVDNVCERAALISCIGGELIAPKAKLEGMTVSLARRKITLHFD